MSEPIRLTFDDPATINSIRWRVASSGLWPAENAYTPPFGSIVIDRPPLTDIEIEVTGGARTTRYVVPAMSREPEPVLAGRRAARQPVAI
jgi:hypothetical protein